MWCLSPFRACAQSYVEVFVRLPPGVEPSSVLVHLTPASLHVRFGEETILGGDLFSAVKAEESVWLMSAFLLPQCLRHHRLTLGSDPSHTRMSDPPTGDGILEIQLLKRNRRGQYANGCTNADTFWYSLLASAKGNHRLALDQPPAEYYKSDWERVGILDAAKAAGRRRGNEAPIAIAA